jgi:Ca2+:H+ antiporter
MWRADSIKREARKEAWYGDSSNPFRKVGMTRSNTWNNTRKQDDPELGREELRHMQSEPMGSSSGMNGDDGVRRPSKISEVEMTKAHGPGRSSDPESATTGETLVEKQSTRPPSQELKARKKFVNKFFGKNKSEDNKENGSLDDTPKKRPWYKGKVLKHKPFTVKNQLQATIFNSWVNILLLAAPAGIAVNYAELNGVAIFVVNFIAIIPLAGMLSFATEEIALHVGESLGGLLNASFG